MSIYTSFKKWIYYYVKKYGLTVTDLNGCAYRIKNKKGQYVDYWKNGSWRGIDGKHHRQGASMRGIGIDETYDYRYAPVDEIMKLIAKENL